MMKKMSKILVVLLSMSIVLGMSITSFAAEENAYVYRIISEDNYAKDDLEANQIILALQNTGDLVDQIILYYTANDGYNYLSIWEFDNTLFKGNTYLSDIDDKDYYESSYSCKFTKLKDVFENESISDINVSYYEKDKAFVTMNDTTVTMNILKGQNVLDALKEMQRMIPKK